MKTKHPALADCPAVLHFQYREIADRDFTAISITLVVKGNEVAHFVNWDSKQEHKETWANQSETFQLPSIQLARGFIQSAGRYQEVADFRATQ